MQITYIGTIQSHGLSGRGDAGWQNLARTIKDCHTILVSGAGDTPKKILGTMGFTIHEVNGMIDLVLVALKKGESLAHRNIDIDADTAQRLLPQVRAAAAAGNKPVTPELLESIYRRTLCVGHCSSGSSGSVL
ncbi:hypothetical protein [Desulfobacter latus]|uniref:hypothetical protein n=1 Tax=Desulfobacter latus TaxID=2292 RepID=UPI001FE29A3E|nr:hypothetical protein [Desulfobacter latus]